MIKVIIDTNIVFSCLLNTQSLIGDLLLNSDDIIEFYSASYLKEEINTHTSKIQSISSLSEEQLSSVYLQVYSKINFISEEIIPFQYWKKAADYVRDVDMDDIAFVALSLFMNDAIPLWTGDEKLRKALIAKGFQQLINTKELALIRKEIDY